MKRTIPILCCLAAVLLLAGCHEENGPKRNSAYYWSTTFRLDSTQLHFIARHHVERIYLRYFDVVIDPDGQLMPNATVRFESPRPQGVEIVPTIFIMNNCLQLDVSQLDSLILQRVVQMCETHDIDSVKELQIDCDWTQRSRKTYFALLERLHERAARQGLRLSATIRLHQLAETPPPVDRGVLMMYNTGDVTDRHHNPILEMETIKPYLRHLSSYRLPLSAAYPAFSWDLLFRGDRFVGVVHSADEYPILPTDTILHRIAEPSTVMEAKEAVGRLAPHANDEIILYEISNTNMANIKKHSYEKIYHP